MTKTVVICDKCSKEMSSTDRDTFGCRMPRLVKVYARGGKGEEKLAQFEFVKVGHVDLCKRCATEIAQLFEPVEEEDFD